MTPCPPAQAHGRRGQARAFLDVADIVLSEPATQTETHVAAALAVLAAIAAADAICGLHLGRYSRGQDHDQAVALLETIDLDDRTLVAELRRVLASKDSVHYSRAWSPRPTPRLSSDMPERWSMQLSGYERTGGMWQRQRRHPPAPSGAVIPMGCSAAPPDGLRRQTACAARRLAPPTSATSCAPLTLLSGPLDTLLGQGGIAAGPAGGGVAPGRPQPQRVAGARRVGALGRLVLCRVNLGLAAGDVGDPVPPVIGVASVGLRGGAVPATGGTC